MSAELRELHLACASADSDKSSDRKKWSEQIKVLLDKKSICYKLHNVDPDREGKQISWDVVFKYAVRIFEKDNIAVNKSKSSKTSRRTSDPLLLIKTVLKNSSSDGQVRLKPTNVVKLLKNFLIVEDLRDLYAQDLLGSVFKHFLFSRDAWINLDNKLAIELCENLKNLLTCQNTNVNVDLLMISRVFCVAVEHVTNSKTGLPHSFASQSDSIFRLLRNSILGSSLDLCENILRVCNLIVCSWFLDLRNYFCSLGEELFLSLLNIWKKRPSEKLKVQILMFYRLQILLHHPCESGSKKSGFFSNTNSADWEVLLKELFHVLVNSLNEPTNRGRFLSSASDFSEESSLIFAELMSELLHLMVTFCGDPVLEEDGSCPTKEDICSPLAKRRKVAECLKTWGWILRVIRSNPSVISSWSSIICCVLTKYPMSIPVEDLLLLAEEFVLYLYEGKRSSFIESTLRSLSVIISSLHERHNKELLNSNLIKNLTQSVESLITTRHAIDQSFLLLSGLMDVCLYWPSDDLWMSFQPNLIKPSPSSLNFVLTYLGVSSQASEGSLKHKNLRLQLLRWLLPELNILGEGSNSSLTSLGILSPENFSGIKISAAILSMICMCKPRLKMLRLNSSKHDNLVLFPQRKLYDSFTNKSLQIAGEMLLLTTLDNFELSSITNDDTKMNPEFHLNDSANTSTLPHISKNVIGVLYRDLCHLNSLGIQNNLCLLEKHAMMCCLSVEFLFISSKEWKCPLNDSRFQELIQQLKVCFQKLYENMTSYCSISQLPELGNLVSVLLEVLEACLHVGSGDVCAKFLKNILPSGFPDFFLGFVKKRKDKRSSDIDSVAYNDGDDDDMFGTHVTPSIRNSGDVDDFFDSNSSQQEPSSNGSMPPSCNHLPPMMKREEQVQILMTRWLCTWVNLYPDFSSHILHGLVSMVSSEVESSSCYSLQLRQTIVEELTSSIQLDDGIVSHLVDLIRSFSEKSCKKDQEVTRSTFNLLTAISPHLESHEEGYTCASNIINFYWQLMLKGDYYNEETCLSLVKCTLSYMKIKSLKGSNQDILSSSMCDIVSKMLKKRKFLFRIAAAHIVPSLFGNGESFETQIYITPKSRQLEIFQMLSTTIHELLGDATYPVASFFHVLIVIWKSSLVCQKRAINFILQSVKDHPSIPFQSFDKVFTHLMKDDRTDGQKDFVSMQISHSIKFWLEAGNSILEFPYKVLSYEDFPEFFECHKRAVIPKLALRIKHHDDLDKLASLLRKDISELLVGCLPETLHLLIPYLSASRLDTICSPSELKDALLCSEKLPFPESIEISIKKHLIKIVQGIFLDYFEFDESLKINITNNDLSEESNYPEPDFILYNRTGTMAATTYLMTLLDVSNFMQLTTLTPDGLQSIAVELTSAFHEQTSLFEKLRLILSLEFLISLLIPHLHLISTSSLPFLIQLVITFSTNFLYTAVEKISRDIFKGRQIIEVGHIVRVLCKMFTSFLIATMEVLPEEVIYFLPLIVSCAVNLVRNHEEWKEMGLEILRIFYCKNGREIKDALNNVDPLPLSICQDLNIVDSQENEMTLKEVIEKFLTSSKAWEKISHAGGEALSRSHRFEALLKSLKINSSDIHQHLLHIKNEITEHPQHSNFLLFFTLLKTQFEILLESKDCIHPELLDIAACLGVIGPVVFDHPMEKEIPLSQVEELPLLSLSDDVSVDSKIITFYLSRYLNDDSTKVVRTTCSVLKQLLKSEKGRNAIENIKEAEGKNTRTLSILSPFVHCEVDADVEVISTVLDLKSLLMSNMAWHNFKTSSQSFFLSLLSSKEFARDKFLFCLKPICELKSELCRFLLPCVFHKILMHPDSSKLANYISTHLDSILYDFVESRGSSKETIEDIINVVQYLRTKQKTKDSTSWDNNYWLRIDFFLLAKAALKLSKFYSALLFSEIHCLHKGDVSCREVQNIWMEVYNRIGDVDSIYGCSNHIFLEPCNRLMMLERNDDWIKSLVMSNLLMTQDVSLDHVGSAYNPYSLSMMKALHKLGCQHLLDLTLSKPCEFHIPEDIKEIQYQSAWEMSKWDLNIEDNLNEKANFHELIYGSMQALRHQNLPLLENHINYARKSLVESIKMNHHEGQCLSSMMPSLTRLRCFSELEELTEVLKDGQKTPEEVLKRWQSEKFLCDFDNVELILKHRFALSQIIQSSSVPFSQASTFSSCGSSQSTTGMHNSHAKQCLLQLTTHALKAKRLEVAEKAIMAMKAMPPEVSNLTSIQDWQLEEAKIFWARGELDMAKYLIKGLVDKQENSVLGAKCLLLYGNILVEMQSENPIKIIESFYKKAVDVLSEDLTSSETSVDAFYSLGSYADVQYKMKVDYMESSAFDDKLELMNQARNEVLKMKESSQTNSRYFKTQDKQLKIDEIETQQLRSDCNQFLFYSLENYLRCLQRSSKYDSCVYRLISLWFNNLNDDNVNEVLSIHLPKISSHKFVPLMYQLAARMNLSKDSFQMTLTKIVERAASEHPHHVLPVILSLAHANLDDSLLAKSSRRDITSKSLRGNQNEFPNEERMIAAQNLIGQLKKRACINIQLLTNNMELLSRAYIELANLNVEKYKSETKPIKFPTGITLLQMKHHPSVSLPTVDIPISPVGKYDEIIHMIGIENTFSLAGGINLPKIITCRCSDGIRRKQLVKGKDDLRQDAVMQQVFTSVNGFLKRDDQTRRRNLRIRTYKVVPLSQRSGLLEWCADTRPLGDYLCGSVGGAHQRYRPRDLKPMECRKQMTMVHGRPSDNEKLAVFMNICKNFQPVFRHFFLENFPEPTKWFQRRLAYTKSVATNSIVGYILGLGDRHIQNILVDMKLAELIHIDFGVAFEQGWNLPTPETVPFRLTRDLVDGMGVTGVEGVFRRCCENTMMVMRANREVMMTIIEVFLYDPLYDWAMSPFKAYHVQNKHKLDLDAMEASEGDIFTDKSDNNHLNKVAKRVLLRMNQKLCGFEGSTQLGIEGHVSRLIQQATDPKNLSRLFPGWQPYV